LLLLLLLLLLLMLPLLRLERTGAVHSTPALSVSRVPLVTAHSNAHHTIAARASVRPHVGVADARREALCVDN